MAGQSREPSQPAVRGWQGVWSSLTLPSPLPVGRVLEHLSNLSREVNLDYERSMNKINFDKIVSSKPETFSYVTLPKKEEEKVPKQGEDGWAKVVPWPPLARALQPLPLGPPCPQNSSPSFPTCLESWGLGSGIRWW